MTILDICVRFIENEYHGSEWPPSPFRLFQALVAGSPEQTDALEWLEKQSPPHIFAFNAHKQDAWTSYVPTNHIDEEKPMRAKEMRLWLLENGEVHYVWELDDIPHAEALQQISRQVRCLGWGVDLANGNAEILDTFTGDGEHYAPESGGENKLEIPCVGSHESLLTAYRVGSGDVCPRQGLVSKEVGYRNLSEQPPKYIILKFGLHDVGGKSISFKKEMTTAIAGVVRGELGKLMQREKVPSPDWISKVVMGHDESGPVQDGPRLSYLPMMTVGGYDDLIRRVMISVPYSERKCVPAIRHNLVGRQLVIIDKGRPITVVLRNIDNDGVSNIYLETSDTWHTITPVVLPGYNTDNGRQSIKKTDRLVNKVLAESGMADMVETCRWYPTTRFPSDEHLNKYPQCHLEIRFKKSVYGPIFMGLGKHRGLGIFVHS